MNKVNSEKLKSISKKYIDNNRRATYLVVALFIWSSWATLGTIRNNYELQQKTEELNEKIIKLRLENERLEYSNEFYKTEEYVELSARASLNKLAPGEQVLVVDKRDDKFNTINQEQVLINSQDNRSNFKQWIDFLFGLKL